MATTHKVRLIRGPCANTTKTISQAEWDAGETTCKGAVYVFDGVIRPAGQLPHFTYRPGAPPPPTDSTSGGSVAPNVYRAWGDIEQGVNRRLPSALHRIGISQRRVLQVLIHKRRVRG